MGLYEILLESHKIPEGQISLYINAIEDLFDSGEDFGDALDPWLKRSRNRSGGMNLAISNSKEVLDRLTKAIEFLEEKYEIEKEKKPKSRTEVNPSEIDSVCGGNPARLNLPETLIAVQRLIDSGFSTSQISKLLMVTEKQVQRYKLRLKRDAMING